MKKRVTTRADWRRYHQVVAEVRAMVQENRERRKPWPVRLCNRLKARLAKWYTRM